MTSGIDGWGEYKLLVVDALERLDRHVNELRKELGDARIEIADLKARSSLWGAVGGAVVSALAAVAWMLAKGGS